MVILVSMCLIGIDCNYKGQSKPNQKVIELVKMGKAIPVCPEQLGGLPTPREPCRLKDGKVIGKDGKDYTKYYKRGAELTLKIAKMFGVRKAYLKKNSPSCGKGGITRKLLEENGIRVYEI